MASWRHNGWFVVGLLVFPSASMAQSPPPGGPNHAEYERLTQELAALAERNAWSGAARTYAKLVATGVEPSYEDLVYGAHAARAIGNIGAVRARLLAAKNIREEKDVIDTLWQLDNAYASVSLQCDPGNGWELTSATRPFEPAQARAIEYAIAAVADSCSFEGFLPAGTYVFAGSEFVVQPGVNTVGMDMRGLPVPRKQRRKAKQKE